MKTNRRGFFKVLGAGAVGAAAVKTVKAKETVEFVPDDTPYVGHGIMVSAYVPEDGARVSAASTLTLWEDET